MSFYWSTKFCLKYWIFKFTHGFNTNFLVWPQYGFSANCFIFISWEVFIFWYNVTWKICNIFIPPTSTKLKGGYTGITLSVCPSVRLSVCPSVDKIVSALYLQQYSWDPFHICTSYQATKEGVSRVMPVSKFKNLNFGEFFKFVTLTLSFFDLGSNMTRWYG